jgi:hypothetical protein
MTEFERRLRAAMADADEPPPAGLLDGIRRRHRRHVRRMGAAWVGAVAAVAIAVPLVAQGIRTGPAGRGPGGSLPAASSPARLPGLSVGPTLRVSPPAPPNSVVRTCTGNNNGTLGRNWKARSVAAGPVWFIYVRSTGARSSRSGLTVGKPAASGMVIAIRNGHAATVTKAPAARGRFRFLAHSNRNGRPYTMTEGAPNLFLSGCPAIRVGINIPESYAPGLTMFWQGYVTDLRGCVPLEVHALGVARPIRVTVPAGRASCGS